MEQIIYIKMDLALNNLQRLICHKTKQTKLGLGNKWTIGDHSNYNIIENKSLGDLRRPAVNQTLCERQLTNTDVKTLKE